MFINNVILVNANVPTGSMENTIMAESRIIGNRLSYIFSEPERGDIVVFENPLDESENYVKRIIAMPGQTVDINKADGKVYVDGDDTADEQKTWDIREKVGLVLQNPDNQLVASIVEEDVAFGPENLGLPREEIRRRVTESLCLVDMQEYAKEQWEQAQKDIPKAE